MHFSGSAQCKIQGKSWVLMLRTHPAKRGRHTVIPYLIFPKLAVRLEMPRFLKSQPIQYRSDFTDSVL